MRDRSTRLTFVIVGIIITIVLGVNAYERRQARLTAPELEEPARKATRKTALEVLSPPTSVEVVTPGELLWTDERGDTWRLRWHPNTSKWGLTGRVD